MSPIPVLIALLSIGIGMLLLAAQGGPANGSVPRRQWPAEGGAAAVAEDRTPVVLKGSPVTQWAALSRWNPEHMSAHGPDVFRLVWHSVGPCLVYAAARGELGGGRRMAGCGDEGAEPALAPRPRAMPPAELFAAAARGVEPGVLYWQDELASLGPQLAAEVEAAPLGLSEVEGGEVAQLAWIGTRGATTQAHHDTEHLLGCTYYGYTYYGYTYYGCTYSIGYTY